MWGAGRAGYRVGCGSAAELRERGLEFVQQVPLGVSKLPDRGGVLAQLLHLKGVDAAGIADGLSHVVRGLVKPAGGTLPCLALGEDIGGKGDEAIDGGTVHYWVAGTSGSNLPLRTS